MNKNKLHKIFLIIVSFQTILMGILFIVQVLRIYIGNDKEFNGDICGKYLLQILPVIIIWVLLITFSAYYFKSNEKEKGVKITNVAKLKILENICPKYSEELKEEYVILKKENKKRKISWIINIVIVAICSLMGLMYLLNKKHFDFSIDDNAQMIKLFIHLFPWVVISLISSIITTLYNERSAYKSAEIIKSLIKQKGKNKVQTKKNNNDKIILIARIAIVCIALTLIIHGALTGGASKVLEKAIAICTECIGLA